MTFPGIPLKDLIDQNFRQLTALYQAAKDPYYQVGCDDVDAMAILDKAASSMGHAGDCQEPPVTDPYGRYRPVV